MALYTTIFLGSTAIGGPVTGWAAERWARRRRSWRAGRWRSWRAARRAGRLGRRRGRHHHRRGATVEVAATTDARALGNGRYGRNCCSIRVIWPPSTVIHQGTSSG